MFERMRDFFEDSIGNSGSLKDSPLKEINNWQCLNVEKVENTKSHSLAQTQFSRQQRQQYLCLLEWVDEIIWLSSKSGVFRAEHSPSSQIKRTLADRLALFVGCNLVTYLTLSFINIIVCLSIENSTINVLFCALFSFSILSAMWWLLARQTFIENQLIVSTFVSENIRYRLEKDKDLWLFINKQ